MTPEQEHRFRRAWIKQNQMDVIKKPRIAHMHNQELLRKGIKKRSPSTPEQKISERSRRINILLHKKLDVTTIADLLCCLLYTSPSPRDAHESRMPSSA
mgnify:CR=1 FL=1